MKRASARAAGAAERDIPGLPARRTASRLLGAVIDARTPLDALTDQQHGHPQYLALAPRDRALVRAILATALRYRLTIAALIDRHLDRPLPPAAHALSHLLHVAAAQILFLDVPDSAAVDLAVSQAKLDPRNARFAALVNAVLRGLARGKAEELPPALASTVDAPAWFADRLRQTYGAETAAAILAAHRTEAPTDLTVKADPERWAERLGGFVLPTGSVRLPRLDRAVPELEGFAEGAWWVQDAAAALPARMLGDIAGLSVADLCAAPGGKTAQLAAAGAKVTAIDSSRNRLARLTGNLERLRLAAEIVEADLRSWQPPALFDAVLLDAPCSSTGTVRRHPDVPWTKSPEDIAKLAASAARPARWRLAGWSRRADASSSRTARSTPRRASAWSPPSSPPRLRQRSIRSAPTRCPARRRSSAAKAGCAPPRPTCRSATPSDPGSTASSPRASEGTAEPLVPAP